MVNAALWWIAGFDRGFERRHGNAGVHRATDRVTNHPARPGVEDGSQINEAARYRDVGEVGYPQLIGAIGNDSLGQIREDRPGMIAVGRDHVTPPPFGLKIVLAHQAAQLLAVHHDASVAQRGAHASIAIAFELIADRADPGEDFPGIQHYCRRVIKRGSRMRSGALKCPTR